MLHVNRFDGLTIAVSENSHITQIAKMTILSDDALAVLVPILRDVVGWNSTRIRAFYESQGFMVQEWERVPTDWLTIRTAASSAPALAEGM
jgi:hypothetical protein